MALIAKHSYKWFIILSFLGIIILPGQMPSPMLRTGTIVALGAICLLFEFITLTNINSATPNRKTELVQTWILIVLTILLLVVNFMV